MDQRAALLCMALLVGLAGNKANGQTLNQVVQRVTRIENALATLRPIIKQLTLNVEGLQAAITTQTSLPGPVLSEIDPTNITAAVSSIAAVVDAHSTHISSLTLQMNTCCRTSNLSLIPATCEDIHNLGNSLSGLYTVIENDIVKQVFCDLSDPARIVQEDIANVSVNTGRVHFDASRSGAFNSVGGVVTYDSVKSNVGNGLNSSTGIFIAPKSGVYAFFGSFLKSPNANRASVSLLLNGNRIAKANALLSGITAQSSMSLSAVVHLQPQDQVKAVLDAGALFAGDWQSFQGILIHEDLIPPKV